GWLLSIVALVILKFGNGDGNLPPLAKVSCISFFERLVCVLHGNCFCIYAEQLNCLGGELPDFHFLLGFCFFCPSRASKGLEDGCYGSSDPYRATSNGENVRCERPHV